MKYYTDGFMEKCNPSPTGGGYTITNDMGVVICRDVIKKQWLTNNEAETMGIFKAIELASPMDIISTDSKICLTWAKYGWSKARPDLNDVLGVCRKLIKEKNLVLIWERRDKNLAGIVNEYNQGGPFRKRFHYKKYRR